MAPTVVIRLPRASTLLAHISVVAIKASQETGSTAKVSLFFAYSLEFCASSKSKNFSQKLHWKIMHSSTQKYHVS